MHGIVMTCQQRQCDWWQHCSIGMAKALFAMEWSLHVLAKWWYQFLTLTLCHIPDILLSWLGILILQENTAHSNLSKGFPGQSKPCSLLTFIHTCLFVTKEWLASLQRVREICEMMILQAGLCLCSSYLQHLPDKIRPRASVRPKRGLWHGRMPGEKVVGPYFRSHLDF